MNEVDICNLALSHIGDTANVVSIDPPEGSAQAGHCARFYPIARNTLQEMHPWGFCTTRVTLAQVAETVQGWNHVYIVPSDALNLISVLPPQAISDYGVPLGL